MGWDTEIPLNQLYPVINLKSLGVGGKEKNAKAGNNQIPYPHTPSNMRFSEYRD